MVSTNQTEDIKEGTLVVEGWVDGVEISAHFSVSLTCIFLHCIVVQYPNLYATPGYHKEADAFNRVQRGHQNMFENMSTFSLMALVGGLKYPIACSIYSTFYNVGCVLFQAGYSDTKLDVAMARYKKGGAIKWIGFFGALGSTVSVAGSMIGWW